MKTDNIQDIYELAPLQKGILFHSLYAPELGLYFFQFSHTLYGNLNLTAFEQAWQKVVNRHTALRTGFYWEEIDKPLQVVYKNVKVPLEQHDWRAVDPIDQQKRLKSFLDSDRQRGFDFSQESLIRLSLIRLTNESYEFIFSKHHLILDGWSSSMVIKDFAQHYEAFCQGKDAPSEPGSSFGSYINWLQQQDISQSEDFWRQALKGIKTPTALTNLYVDNLSTQAEKYDEEVIYLSETTTTALQSLAKKNRLTLNTFVQAAWAILLSYYTGEKNVVYGCTLSARPLELAEAESIVGTFVNTLPVAIKVNGEQFLLPWLRDFQAHQVEMRQYDYTPLTQIQAWSEIPRGIPMFDSILVFENYPVAQVLQEELGSLELQESGYFYKTNYPLTVVGLPGLKLGLGINYDFRRFDNHTIKGILEHFKLLLENMVTNPEVRIRDLSFLTVEEQEITLILEKAATFDFEFANCN
ncbi:condensation domain-containing protein [Nodularia sp. NIES-3585]|uniref:condensation domain-containing protein n=1 Tax=Nodularia sp. NIES-3585 TaxID=1973477 RepID=UPI000B5C822C|nr:condensation domain-containing protein [Nodularia sp. NIES-3585]GAX38389.1 nonribosomal protein synthetase condensation domain [Nodularia sp. NIES-3585]